MNDTLELILKLLQTISIVASLIGILIGVYKAIRNYKKDLQEEEKRKELELNQKIESLKKEVIDLKLEQRVNEKDRLKDTILNFAEKVRYNKHNPQVYDININSYNVIFDDYAKYKNLGGNSYVDEEMKFIKKEFQNLHYEEV